MGLWDKIKDKREKDKQAWSKVSALWSGAKEEGGVSTETDPTTDTTQYQSEMMNFDVSGGDRYTKKEKGAWASQYAKGYSELSASFDTPLSESAYDSNDDNGSRMETVEGMKKKQLADYNKKWKEDFAKLTIRWDKASTINYTQRTSPGIDTQTKLSALSRTGN